ncbi:HK97 family phage prohead protease [Sphingomonas arantia]|uniref:HK97 family phage prohead protease n=1 Tax=Sphingomonas arantia TaxID=1460676 RepID=A0ABW4U1R7_9SPHN
MSVVRFEGYAALFDVVDRGGDIVRSGAFARSLAGRPGRVALLRQHGGLRPVGTIDVAVEDARGLRVAGQVPAGSAMAAALLAGDVTGLSFGYRSRRERRGTYRELIDVDLLEVSLVAVPMQPGARVDRVW